MSVSTNGFLSHPGKPLDEHLVQVATRAENIMHETRFESGRLAYYAGLLHDIGKLNPFYQELFKTDDNKRRFIEDELQLKYERQHALFSAWATEKLLSTELNPDHLQLVLCAIAAHHSHLSNEIQRENPTERMKRTKQGLLDNLVNFKMIMSTKPHFSTLDWDECLAKFTRPMSFETKLRSLSGNSVRDFIEASMIFSSLLQADRGSFAERPDIQYDLHMSTNKLVNVASGLSKLRTEFQKWYVGIHNFAAPVSVLNAPTGMGKTKVFLDLINGYSNRCGIKRVMYFSPLLALTEDFESKIKDVLSSQTLDEVLVYNHLFTGSLSNKLSESRALESFGYNFENESFHSKFVISTTQRLLMILYFNSTSDKMKLASLRDALLIIDEIQVIPKFLLSNLIKMLQTLCQEMNTRILLVSATIPYELSKNVPITRIPQSLLIEYHQLTLKKIRFMRSFAIPSRIDGKKTLIMANTRKKAREIYETLKNGDLSLYASSGIRKKTRTDIIQKVKEKGTNLTVVSTQVLEAGVDVSFAEVYREAAPLDNIVQVMGRLNREGETKEPILHIFQKDLDHLPYSELEYQESLKILKKVKNSKELYDELDGYYEHVSAKNVQNVQKINELDRLINDMDFEGVSRFVNNYVFADEGYTVIVPETEQDLHKISVTLKSTQQIDKRLFRSYSALTANLPASSIKLARDYLDQELFERGILIPKKDCLHDVYDNEVGLDKWTK